MESLRPFLPMWDDEKAADISKKALQTGTSVRSIILQEGLLDEEELDHILDPVRMTERDIGERAADEE